MPTNLSRSRLAGFWIAGGAAIVASVVGTHVSAAISSAPLLLTLWLAPPALMLLVWRGAPPPTVAELLHAVHSTRDGRS